MEIEIVEGDITTERVDAIVNASNAAIRRGGGVSGAIHAAGGPEIEEDCRRRYPVGLPTGAAGWTTAGRLPAKHVIHVVGPNWHQGQRDPALLAAGYRVALEIADELGDRSIAFPAISAGIYGWPLADAARTAVDAVRTAQTRVVERARFVLFSDDILDAFGAAYGMR